MLRTALFAAATAASASLPAVPAAAHSTDSHTELNPVVITATGSELRRSQVAPATHIINRAEIERAQATDLGELLRFVAGIDVARSGGPGGQTSVFIRGGESDHTLVLLDGTPINDGVNGLAPFPVIEPAMIDRIEIIKGPRASLYGSAGLAGVINVITRNAEDQSLSINSRVGADNTRDLGARASWHGASGDSLTVQFQRQSTDGIPPFTSSTEDRGLRRNTLQISGRVPRGDWALDAKLWRSQSELEYDSGFSSPSYRSQQSRNRAVQLGLGGAVTANWSTRLALHDLDDELDQDQSSNFSHTRRSTLQWTNQLEIRVAIEAAGAEAEAASLNQRRRPEARAQHRDRAPVGTEGVAVVQIPDRVTAEAIVVDAGQLGLKLVTAGEQLPLQVGAAVAALLFDVAAADIAGQIVLADVGIQAQLLLITDL